MRLRTIALLALFAAFAAHAEEIPQGAVVRFNTACARCHEGECSGRLSFGPDHTVAAHHVRRYAGEVSADEQKALHTLLAYMKQRCAYYPMRIPEPKAGGWDRTALASLRGPAGDAYFIPLGTLAAGRYRVHLRFDAAAEACAQVISARFAIDEYPGLKAVGQGMEFEFAVDDGLPYYLRLQTASPAVLERLEILPLHRNGVDK